MIGKLLGAVTIGSSFANTRVLRRFLSGMARLVVLAIVCAFMICIMLAGVFYALYSCLVYYGLDIEVAVIVIGGFFLCLMTILVTMVRNQLQQLQALSCNCMKKDGNGWPDIGNIANAFLDGFFDRTKQL